jgi:competence protein ComGC
VAPQVLPDPFGMAEKQRKRAEGRTLIKLVLLLAIFGLVMAIAIPNYVKSRTTASMHQCYFTQMWIEKAKAQWALDNHKADTDVPTEAEVLKYMRRITPMWCGRKFHQYSNLKAIPTCFNAYEHEKYVLGAVGERVRCPISQRLRRLNSDGDHQCDGCHEWGSADLNDELFRRHYRM